MAVISKEQMDSLVREAVKDAREKAEEVGIKYGIVGLCFSNESSGTDCFDDLMAEEDRLRIFPIVENGSCIIPPESNPVGFIVAIILSIVISVSAWFIFKQKRLI